MVFGEEKNWNHLLTYEEYIEIVLLQNAIPSVSISRLFSITAYLQPQDFLLNVFFHFNKKIWFI